MKNERIKVGYNDAEAYNHQAQSNLKLECLQSAIIEFKKQCNADIDNLGEFEMGFYNYSLQFIKNKHKAGTVLGLQDLEFCRLYGYNFEKLQQIEANYNTQLGSIKIFKNIASIDENLDFNIYAVNERELQKFNDVTELIKAVKNIYERYYSGQMAIQGLSFMNRLYVLNADATELIPNKFFIKNE